MKRILYGLLLSIVIAVSAIFINNFFPFGGASIAIALGAITINVFKIPERFQPGINFVEKKILAWAIILMGAELNVTVFKEAGWTSILFIVVAISISILFSLFLSKLFNFNTKLSLLLGIGNGICGSSAIAATEKIVGADKKDVGISVAVVNFLGTIGMFAFPVLIHLFFNFSSLESGYFIGSTLQSVGQVVATGFTVNDEVGHLATIYKMIRILMLTPVVFVLIFLFHRKKKKDNPETRIKLNIPYFIIGFLIIVLLVSFHFIPDFYIKPIGRISHYLLIIAMAGIGLKINFSHILKEGKKAVIIGSLIFLIQILFALLVVNLVL